MKKKLNTVSLIGVGIGGIIGAGYFLGTGLAVRQAGPAVSLAFFFGGLIMIQVLGGINSIHVNRLEEGSFRTYVEEFLGPFFGFLLGWIIFVSSILTIGAEAVAMGTFVKYWLPNVSLPLMATLFTITIIMLNAVGVGTFGWLESGMAIVKTLIVIVFILSGVWLIWHNGVLVHPAPLSDLHTFFPKGIYGFLQAMLIAAFCFSGVSVVAMASTDAENPRQVIPFATAVATISIVLLYVASMLVLVTVVPWSLVDINKSPYVQAFDTLGLKLAATALNFIILIAAFSVMAATYYATIQILRSLAETKKAPAAFARTSKKGLFQNAWLAVGAASMGVVGVSFVLPHQLFRYLVSATSYFTLLTWVLILITYLLWLKGRKTTETYTSPLIMGRAGAYLTIAAIWGLGVISLKSTDFRMGFYTALLITALISLAYPIWLKWSH